MKMNNATITPMGKGAQGNTGLGELRANSWSWTCDHGTKTRKINVAINTRCTKPERIFVRPDANVSRLTANVRTSSTVSF